jgi:hypothetical protein
MQLSGEEGARGNSSKLLGQIKGDSWTLLAENYIVQKLPANKETEVREAKGCGLSEPQSRTQHLCQSTPVV